MPSITNRTLVDTVKTLRTALRAIHEAKDDYDSDSDSPLLYVDLEGVNLCRYGSLSLVQIFVPILDHTYVIDVTVLGEVAFTTSVEVAYSDTSIDSDASSDLVSEFELFELSLKTVLESESYVKCFFDVRNDADALYGLFGVSMKGVVDLQLLENASRRGNKKHLSGLAKSIRLDAGLSSREVQRWSAVKEKVGQGQFDYSLFDVRPLRTHSWITPST